MRSRFVSVAKMHSVSTGPGLYARFGKRLLDLPLACVALVASSPVLLACSIAVWLDSNGPVIYSQWRVGQYGRRFKLLKFRTMVVGADKQGLRLTASGDRRITLVGRFLRKTKLDELPQLINVFRGEMSLVGPRPEVPEYVALYSPAERAVLTVKPGITGPASLAFIDEERLLAERADQEDFYVNSIMTQKLLVDLDYCSRVSLRDDLKLIARTVASVCGSRLWIARATRTKSA
jgi:lipopolysaccharide/colanic/teichoic acid biosynthesis glycosyltransferase